MRTIAFAGDVELTTNVSFPAFGAVIRSTAKEHNLQATEYSALWSVLGAQRRGGAIAHTRDDVPRIKQLLAGDRMIVEQDAQPMSVAHDHRVALLDGVTLLPTIYEVRDERRPIRFIGVFEAAIIEACDGRRTVADLDAVVRSHGYDVQLADIAGELDHLRAAGLVTAQNGAFRKRHDLVIRPDAVLVRALWSDLSFLMSGDEADVVLRCREARSAGEIVHELGATTPQEESWVLQALARASTLKLLAHTAPRPSQLHMPGGFVDDDRTTIAAMDQSLTSDNAQDVSMAAHHLSLTTGDAMTMVATEDPRTAVLPSTDATPSGAGQMFARMLPPSRPSWPTIMHADSEVQISNGAPPPPPSQPLVPVTGRDSRDIEARLASLSLPKDGSIASGPPANPGAPTFVQTKLPWILLAVVVVGFGIYQLTKSSDSGDAPPPPPPIASNGSAGVAPVASGRTLLAAGFIAAKTPITLSAQAGNRIDEVSVAAGDKIKKGQVVAVLADAGIRAELGLARAKYSAAAAQASRMRALVKAQAATPVEYEKARGAVEVAAAEVGIAKQKLDDTRVKSPIDGTVLEVLAHPGEVLAAGPAQSAGVLRIADLTILVAEVNVNESDLGSVYVGQEAELVTDAQRDQKRKGTVHEIAQQADRAKGTVLVKVDLEPDPDTTLKPGMTIQVRFVPKPKTR